MKIQKLLAILMVMAMLLAVMAGCAGGNAPEESEAPVESAPASEAPASEAPAEALPAEEDLADVSTADVGGTLFNVTYLETPVEYPLSDTPVELTYYTSTMPNLLQYIPSYNDHMMMPLIEEKTGVHLEFIESSMSAYSEQFNLIVAGGEYYDFMDCSNYAGGMPKAFTDGVIIDLTTIAETWGPDFLYAAKSAGTTYKDLMTDDGLLLYMCTINDLYQPISGMSIRQDWLDEQGLQAPQTIDQLTEVLKAFKEAYDCKSTMWVDNDGLLRDVFGAFGVNAIGFKTSSMPGMNVSPGSEVGCFQKDGTVYSSLTLDEYRDYTEFQKMLFDEGLIDKDFFSAQNNPNDNAAKMGNGFSGVFFGNADEYSTMEAASEDPDINIVGIKPIVMNEGDSYLFGEKPTYMGMHKTCVTTGCETPEIAVGFMNWFYTMEGSIASSYGIEGTSYSLDADGNPQLTDLVLRNPDQMPTNVASMYYTFGLIPTYLIRERLWPGYLQKELDALNLWTQNVTAEYTMPAVSMTTEESNRYSSLASDIYTYASEVLLKFVVGESELNDQSWADFQKTIKDLGIDECVALHQDALDRYQVR